MTFIAREKTGCRYYVGSLSDWQQGLFYMHHPIDRITHIKAFVTPVVEHWLEQEIALIQTQNSIMLDRQVTRQTSTGWNEK